MTLRAKKREKIPGGIDFMPKISRNLMFLGRERSTEQ